MGLADSDSNNPGHVLLPKVSISSQLTKSHGLRLEANVSCTFGEKHPGTVAREMDGGWAGIIEALPIPFAMTSNQSSRVSLGWTQQDACVFGFNAMVGKGSWQ